MSNAAKWIAIWFLSSQEVTAPIHKRQVKQRSDGLFAIHGSDREQCLYSNLSSLSAYDWSSCAIGVCESAGGGI